MMNAVGITCMMHTAKSTAMLRSSVLKTAMMVGLNSYAQQKTAISITCCTNQLLRHSLESWMQCICMQSPHKMHVCARPKCWNTFEKGLKIMLMTV